MNQTAKSELILGDCYNEMFWLADNSIDAIVTDPPYGLSFMGKKWDYDVPSVKIWKEVLRVLKPGGHLLSFCGTRTYHRMVVRIEDAGFEIRDQIMWLYGQGFPKSLDISKALDKMATIPATEAAKQWAGWGTALKPANEPICLARKPLSESTVAKNVLKWGVGGINVDGCRIGMKEGEENPSIARYKSTPQKGNNGWEHANRGANFNPDSAAQGRFPANLLLDEEAALALDAQSGLSKPHGKPARTSSMGGAFGNGKAAGSLNQFADSGGASRFFYVAKVSAAERNAGLEGMPDREGGIKNTSGRGYSERDPHKPIITKNAHPTVKPIKLMEYLCKLVTPPGGVVLDPFMGSGSTGVAAKRLGFHFIGIDKEKDYFAIAKKRIDNV